MNKIQEREITHLPYTIKDFPTWVNIVAFDLYEYVYMLKSTQMHLFRFTKKYTAICKKCNTTKKSSELNEICSKCQL